MLAPLLASVFVLDERPLTKLGPKTVLHRVLQNLAEVRGLAAVTAYVAPKYLDQVTKIAKPFGVLTKVSKSKLDATFQDRHLVEHSTDYLGQTGVMFIFPYLPFAPESAYESCVRTVRRGWSPSAVLTGNRLEKASPATQAFLLKAPVASPTFVKLSKIEAMDVRDHDDLVIASALVYAKKVK